MSFVVSPDCAQFVTNWCIYKIGLKKKRKVQNCYLKPQEGYHLMGQARNVTLAMHELFPKLLEFTAIGNSERSSIDDEKKKTHKKGEDSRLAGFNVLILYEKVNISPFRCRHACCHQGVSWFTLFNYS